MNYSILRPVDYMCHEKFTWQVPFNLLEQPGFSWRTEWHELCEYFVLIGVNSWQKKALHV